MYDICGITFAVHFSDLIFKHKHLVLSMLWAFELYWWLKCGEEEKIVVTDEEEVANWATNVNGEQQFFILQNAKKVITNIWR